MTGIFIMAELLSIILILIAMILLVMDESGTKEQKLISFFLYGSLVQNVGYLLELTAPTLEAALWAVKVQYLGSISVPLCYCLFIYNYCNAKAPLKLLKALGIIDVGLLAVIFSLDWHSLYYRDMHWLVTDSGHHYLHLSYGPVYWVFLICGCVLPYFLTIFTLFQTVMSRPDYAEIRKCKTIMYLSILPTLALISYACKLTYVFDLTPSVLGLVLALIAIVVWRRNTSDFRRMAANVLLENMGDGVIALDMQMRLLSYNPAAAGIFPSLTKLQTGDGVTDLPQFRTDLLVENINQEFCLNDRFYEAHSKHITDRDGKKQGYVILILDVTDTRNYIQEIKRVREQAEQANAAKSEFLANMSHEIRTPMNAIIGLSDIILEESAGLPLYENAADIKSSAQNLLAIINDILDLSKVEAGKMELVKSEYPLRQTINEVVHMMEIAASQRGLTLLSEWDESVPCQYYGDYGKIKQILINLLNNAIKFTKEGHVKISVGGTADKTEDTELLTFRIEDTGCGIREEDKEKIFENFKQVDSKRNRSVEGTGLGLSITRHFVLLMGGTIELESTYGKGSAFTVTIPQKIVDPRPISEVSDTLTFAGSKLKPFTASGIKALLVDDNLINRKVAKGFLAPYHLELTEAESGFQAIDLVRQTRYDLIFMDHMMPEMDGIEATRIIRSDCGENGTSPVIIALTANAMEGTRELFLESGFQDFLTKPMDRESLDIALQKWIPQDRRDSEPLPDNDSQPPHSEFDAIQIEGIDIRTLARHMSGSTKDYLELLQLYCLDGKRKTVLLQQLYESEDYKNYEVEVHGLKSASANVGAMDFSAMAKEHEAAANQGNIDFIRTHFSELLASYETLLQNIQSFLDAGAPADNADTGDLPLIGQPELVAELGEALHQLETFHSKNCAAKIENLLAHKLDETVRLRLTQIQEQLKLYEDETAENMLRELREELEQ